MRFEVDTHTHTVASGHAYSTIQEMAREAGNNGIRAFVITDHGPAIKGGPELNHFNNLRVVPKVIYGVRVVRGVEANIIGYDGSVDMPQNSLASLEFAIASYHDICISPSTVEDHTCAMIKVLKNPCIDAVAHPGNPQFQVDIEKVVLAAKQLNKLIEINNQSFFIRTGSEENCREFVKMCKKHWVRIVCGSDAHISFDIGKFNKVYSILEEAGIPEELIINVSMDRFESYLEERALRLNKACR